MSNGEKTYLKATTLSGLVVIAAFSKLGGSGERYVGQVFAGARPFNAWKVVGQAHPVSGEAVLLRTRVMLSGRTLSTIEAVKPIAGREETHGYDPTNFEPRVEIQGGRYGLWTVPAVETPEGLVAGTQFPINRAPDTLERYVLLRVAENGQPEKRYVLDAGRTTSYGTIDEMTRQPVPAAGPGDGDDDVDPHTSSNMDEDDDNDEF